VRNPRRRGWNPRCLICAAIGVTVQLAEGAYAALWLMGPLTGACCVNAVTFPATPRTPDRVSFGWISGGPG